MIERHEAIVRKSLSRTSRAMLAATLVWIGIASMAGRVEQPVAAVLVVSR